MIDLRTEAEQILPRYPQGRQRSALLPLLHRVQDRDGYVSQEGMEEVAEILGLTPAEVRSVATFYTMYHLNRKGRAVISVCHNLACSMAGAEEVIAALEGGLGVEAGLGIEAGQTTADGAITLERSECLAFCDKAPMLQVNYDEMVGPITPSEALALARRLTSPAASAVPGEGDSSGKREPEAMGYAGRALASEPETGADDAAPDESPDTAAATGAARDTDEEADLFSPEFPPEGA